MDYKEMVLTILQMLITALVPYLMILISKAISECSKKLQAKTQSEIVDKYIKIAEELLCKIVTDVGENYVKQLKADNKFDIKEQGVAFDMAKETFLNTISDEAKLILSDAVIDLDAWVQANIEACVANQK